MKILALLFTFLCLNAFAAETLITHRLAPYKQNFIEPSFEINRTQGRAWVNVTIYNGPASGPNRKSSLWREIVKGLSFDPMTNLIVYNGTPCATVRGTVITHTGCKFSSNVLEQTYDDGYNRPIDFKMIQVRLISE